MSAEGDDDLLRSMTGFASARGADGRFGWAWELRSVNGKGLDLRLRVPDWIEGLEAALRSRLGAVLTRGNVTLSLRVQSEDSAAGATLDSGFLDKVLSAMTQIEAQAMERGLSLAPATAADVIAVRGVFETGGQDQDTEGLCQALMADFDAVLAAFLGMREAEGRALAGVLEAQIDQIARLTDEAAEAAEARRPEMEAAFRTALARIMDHAEGADEGRIAQELAMLAVKADVTEEIDRLRAHAAATRDLLAKGSPVGRKLDFLMQEFNREANTLCSKAQNARLTAAGLELKTVIDQMREQVQNVE